MLPRFIGAWDEFQVYKVVVACCSHDAEVEIV